jgi:hypothetical protein
MHNRKELWAVIAVAILVTGFLGYKYLISSMTLSGCAYQPVSEEVSPDGEYIASVSERNCGAMSTYTRIVSLRYRTSKFRGDDESSWIFVMLDQPTILVRWTGNRDVTVKAQGYSRTSVQNALKRARWEDVSVLDANP